MTISKLSDEQISEQLKAYPHWQLQNGKLYRRLTFEDFVHAMGFITQIAILAEKANHHPEWANVYRTVDIFLTTHEANGVTERDFALLKHIERLIG
ncbi:4a-hydroxytetrahydrobiopterin dehydratase [Dasania sp. GY-MA-18]|uniref:Putative pterin-4-alpha-carbinolamine dehydratase n=1 Tax=Dasania phycosphaerae TaxID=2950436 RepID=A0A9J6RQU3_9GAMM|nr:MULTISPECIES: 4a-hydroxytetrahydrobiopterin dehydratase [Dasania]MCR8924294.1 4a-hydroxytetrahydrobiopterin dehydratase [Dasania sp. GY-MA-18]MCZ0866947.1 4a-hydroxytetrahydrobiopterin dehydratase [Dasania phycosphaerae]MCZ0870451.1 4a-hydroxytetrahydrobiopterin dehydratase [Dasania phycosphaerae]